MASLPQVSSGEILSTAGITTGRRIINGGFPALPIVSSCTISCGLIISEGLTNIILSQCMEQHLGHHDVIAEDLGYVTDSVRWLVHESGFPGMKVLEFAFDSRDSGSANDYLPHNYVENSVAYTGTHDNETLVGWLDSIKKEELEAARDYMCDHHTQKDLLYKSFISIVMRSNARTCIIPLQDYMGLDNSCRMNQPSTVGKNWRWRLTEADLSKELKEEIFSITRRYGR